MDSFITSSSNSKVKSTVELHRKKGRKQHGLYIIEGFHLVEEAIKQGAELDTLFVVDEKYKVDVSCKTYIVTPSVMKKMATTETPQPILALVRKPNPQKGASQNSMYLDDLQDPGNVGTIIRSAIAFGVDHIIVSPRCVDLFESKVVRAAQGAHFQMTYDICDEAQLEAKYGDLEWVATTLATAQPLHELSVSQPFLLIVGNEARGVKPLLQERANKRVYIPATKMESLNVAVATSICLYELLIK